jgi:phage shock protein C
VNPRRLYRSADDRIFAGVAGGLGEYLEMDPVVVRIIWFLSIFVTGSLTFWVYLIMMIVVPLEPTEWPPQSPWAPGGAPAGYQTGYTPPPPGNAPDPSASGQPPAPAPGGWWSNDWRGQWRQEHWQQRAERWQRRADRHEYHSYGGPGLVFGLLLVLIGGLLAWHQLDPNFDLNLTWPIVIIAFGAILVVSSFRFRDRS